MERLQQQGRGLQKPDKITVSSGLVSFLQEHKISFAFTSYDAGNLYLVGVNGDSLSVVWRAFTKPMGLCSHKGKIFLIDGCYVRRLENILTKGETTNGHDAVFVPRFQHLIGDVDAHEIAVDKSGQIIFANTRYSCLATLSETHSFKPLWKPDFISKLVPEDRCHLNGFALYEGKSGVVSIVGKSDSLQGWRNHRADGGYVIDCVDGFSGEKFSMPHSPRFHGTSLYILDSGRGTLSRYTGNEKIVFCPGFLRGLSFHDRYAIVTVSLPRDGIFKGLELQNEIDKRGGEAWCGVLVIDIAGGFIKEWLRIEGPTKELFDVCWLEDYACPTAIAPGDPALVQRISIEP